MCVRACVREGACVCEGRWPKRLLHLCSLLYRLHQCAALLLR
jgi:hypothetical protein